MWHTCWQIGTTLSRRALYFSTVQSRREAKDAIRKLKLSTTMDLALCRLRLPVPTETLSQVLRPILDGRDVVAVTPPVKTKCLAFLVPLLEKISKGSEGNVAVVVESTRDLAEQTYFVANRIRERWMNVVLVVGGGRQELETYNLLMRRRVHLVVGTLGQICNLVESGCLNADHIRTLVFDETQLMPKSRFQSGVLQLLGEPSKRDEKQCLVFTEKCLPWLDTLKLLRDPCRIDLSGGQRSLPSNLRQLSCHVPGGVTKRARAVAWLLEARVGSAVVFAPTVSEAIHLSTHVMLRDRAVVLHGNMNHDERKATLEFFRCVPGRVLVTTDLTSVGELPSVPLVVHIGGIPSSKSYVARVSNTLSSACETAESILLHSTRDKQALHDLSQDLFCNFERLDTPSEEELRAFTTARITKELSAAVTQYNFVAFEDDAEKQLEVHGPRLLAAALVLLERRTRGEDWISPLSGKLRHTPILFFDPFLERLRNKRAVLQAINRVIRKGASLEKVDNDASADESGPVHVGRVELTTKGYVADVPWVHVQALMTDPNLKKQGISVMPVSQMPSIVAKPDHKRTPKRRLKATRPRNRLRERRKSQRLDFLYPAGRRSPLAGWVSSGEKDSTKAAPQ